MAISSLIGMIRGSDKEQIKALEASRAAAASAEVPDEAMLRYNLEMLKNMGQLTPEMEQEILQEASGMRYVSTDPQLREAQMQALTNMERRGKEGLTLEDRAAAEQINRGVNQNARANQEAVLQNMAARGQLGSGGELAARMQASQSAADTGGQQGMELVRLAAAQKLQATMNAGQMGGDIRGQDFGEQSAKAQAQDMINQFNTSSRQDVQSQNVGSKNRAQQYNLDYAKDLEANRVDTTNQQKAINRDAYTTAMDARNFKRTGIAQAGERIASAKDRQFANRVAAGAELENSALKAGAAIATGGASLAVPGGMPSSGSAPVSRGGTPGGQTQDMAYSNTKKQRYGW
jgi:hypothetical protein